MSGKRLSRKTANQSVKNIIPAKKMQRKVGRDVGQGILEEQTDAQENNVGFLFY